jgi:hypothetical protein
MPKRDPALFSFSIMPRSGTSPRIRKNGVRVVCPPVSWSASTEPSASIERPTSTPSSSVMPPLKPSSMLSFAQIAARLPTARARRVHAARKRARFSMLTRVAAIV